MLDAWFCVLTLSTMMPLVPPVSVAVAEVTVGNALILNASRVFWLSKLMKSRSVAPFKNSVSGEVSSAVTCSVTVLPGVPVTRLRLASNATRSHPQSGGPQRRRKPSHSPQ